MRDSITRFCRAAGSDPLLVQGAGGNVSWKENDTLWIKASGTWLAEAGEKDIFVPVDLGHLRTALAAEDFGATPRVLGASTLRPSIETMLHALMPHPVVVHLHAVEILACLVRKDAEAILDSALDGSLRWLVVPYHKPGAALAKAVAEALARRAGADVVFLQNHGVVLGGDDIAEVERLLSVLLSALAAEPPAYAEPEMPARPLPVDSGLPYLPLADAEVQHLAMDESLYRRLSSCWVLYPDHAVFLGPKAACYDSIDGLAAAIRQPDGGPDLVFVRGDGVYAKPSCGLAKQVQLRCYYDVLVRVPENCRLAPLDDSEVDALLNWDAEKYRVGIKK